MICGGPSVMLLGERERRVADLRVGVATADITPPLGIWMSGYGGRAESTSVLDPLELRALTISDGERTLVIVGADLLGFDLDFVSAARAALAERYGIAPDGVLLNGSHTHAGPAIINHLVSEAPHLDHDYRRRVAEALVEVVGRAIADAEPAEAHHGWGHCKIGINRRQDGPPYAMMPNPRGFYDDAVGVLAFVRPGTTMPLAVLFNAACHPTTLGAQTMLSADWPGAARRAVDDYLGGPRSVFIQGACGNIRPRTFSLAEPTRFRQGTPAEMQRMGHACAHEVIRILQDELRPTTGGLAARRVECRLPLEHVPSRADAEAARAASDVYESAWGAWLLERWPDGGWPDHLPYEVQLLRIGDGVAVLALPGEVVSELGHAARITVPRPTLLAGYSNGLPCYIPSARIRRQGGYEAGLRSGQYFGVPGWLTEAVELVILAAVEQACAED